MAINDNIKKYRLEAGLSPKELAAKLGNAEITIRQYETGKREPSLKKLFDIADALEVSISDIISEDDFYQDSMDTRVKRFEYSTIHKIRAFLKLGGYKLKRINSNSFQIQTDIEYVQSKEFIVNFRDLYELDRWINEYIDVAVAYMYNSKYNPGYEPKAEELPFFISPETDTKK